MSPPVVPIGYFEKRAGEQGARREGAFAGLTQRPRCCTLLGRMGDTPMKSIKILLGKWRVYNLFLLFNKRSLYSVDPDSDSDSV